jgi:hypothetical protein
MARMDKKMVKVVIWVVVVMMVLTFVAALAPVFT